MKTVVISKHAKKRIKERCGIGKGKSERYVDLVLERGIVMEDTKGLLHKWLSARYVNKGGDIIVWGDKAFIIAENNVLITVLQIPAMITRHMKNMITSGSDEQEEQLSAVAI